MEPFEETGMRKRIENHLLSRGEKRSNILWWEHEPVVASERQVACTHSLGKVTHKIAVRPRVHRVPGVNHALPCSAGLKRQRWTTNQFQDDDDGYIVNPEVSVVQEKRAFVVLAGKNDVLKAALGKEIGPLVGIEQFGCEFGCKI